MITLTLRFFPFLPWSTLFRQLFRGADPADERDPGVAGIIVVTLYFVIGLAAIVTIIWILAKAGVFGAKGLLVQFAKLTGNTIALILSPITAVVTLLTGVELKKLL